MVVGRCSRRTGIPDTHAHLDSSVYEQDIADVIARATDAGVDRILAVGSDLHSSRRAVELAQRFPSVYAAVGIHPHEASRFEAEAGGIRALLGEDKVVAVGEIGLDYYRDFAPPHAQKSALGVQLQWARNMNLPVSVHNRDADVDILTAIAGSGCKAVLHCFSGDWAFAEAALDASLYLSFAGNLTYPKASTIREVAAKAPLNRVLLETDSPVLAPQIRRGKRNEPALIVHVLEQLASIRGAQVDAIAQAVSSNADDLFKWRKQ